MLYLNYYDEFIFLVTFHSPTEKLAFLDLYEANLFPFLSISESPRDTFDYKINLRQNTSDFKADLSDWSETVFFNPLTDNAISDFGTGFVKHSSDTSRTIYNPNSGTLFSIDKNTIEVLYRNNSSFTKDFQRLLKQLIVTEIERQGGAILHASAVSFGDYGFCFVGEKGQGKTTSLLQSLQIPDVGYLTNDRLPIIPSGEGFKALGWFEEIRLVIPGSTKKEVVRVTDYVDPSRIQKKPVYLKKIILPTRIQNDSSPAEIVASQMLSPIDPQRPKWLGFSAPQNFPLASLLEKVSTACIHWSYSDLEGLTRQIEKEILNV
ncbi:MULTISPECIES: hypothetical protein [unclassified Pseudomonas]|uniref:hypothetical protein n=1 Tax=unclassified Pseudomonas TaxID=196821 RepID=UPI000871B3B0|nr:MULTISPECIES: hypothetical protein [unclassified Pseudomonas]SCW36544.1 hypothetical protein SAMN03159424_00634 [Pseudomonas sp. NFACC05-1]SFL02367.1 hypothetical protein SAMN03159307_00039 [Pseudomonas sp. NFACC46-3]